MLRYFPDNYWLNMMLSNAVHCGSALGDVDDSSRATRALLEQGHQEGEPAVYEAWMRDWTAVGDRLCAQAAQDVESGRSLSAGEKYWRAGSHYLAATWIATFDDVRKVETFDAMRSSVRRSLELLRPDASWIEIPYEGTTLQGLFVPAETGGGRQPVVIQVNGTHSSIDWPYLAGFVRELSRRGVASLLFDHPGSGRAVLHQGLATRHDIEVPVGAAIDYLQSRNDVDPARIGIMGASLGGYHAPRAACFEKRLAACFCWGGLYELPEWIVESARNPSQSIDARKQRDHKFIQGMMKLMGQDTHAALYEEMTRYTLSGVLHRLTAPLVILHGVNDVQVPLEQAERMIAEAVNSTHAELLATDLAHGGAEHCNMDNLPSGRDLLCDRAAEILRGIR